MIERVNDNNYAEYEAFLASHPKGLFCHTRGWGKVKSAWKWEAIMSKDENGNIKGAGSVLIRFMPVIKCSLLYVCRGFACDTDDFETFDELLSGIKQIAKENKGYVIKIDPEITVEHTDFEKHLRDVGFKRLPTGLDFENVQARFVYVFDYNGMDADELMLTFKPDYRNRIRKAGRKGVEVKICGKEALPDFVEIMKETGERDGFSTRPIGYFEAMLDGLGDYARLYMAYYEGKPIAGTIAINFGKTCKYQYGASSNSYRNTYPNYLLQWKMIEWGLETGAEVYDFGGISGDIENENNPHYGLYRFKRGFNGYIREFIGEYDLVLNPLVYHLYNTADKLRKKLRG